MSICSSCEKEKAALYGLCNSCYELIYHPGSDLQNKPLWAKRGQEKEWEFIHVICPTLGLKAQWNIEDPYAPDLFVNNKLSELKFKGVPFFKSLELFGIPPQYCLAINHKDYIRYANLYPSIDIYFWVDWQELEKKIGKEFYTVRPMFGIYKISFKRLSIGIRSGKFPYYAIPGRANDTTGNAKAVYVFSAKDLDCLVERML